MARTRYEIGLQDGSVVDVETDWASDNPAKVVIGETGVTVYGPREAGGHVATVFYPMHTVTKVASWPVH